MRAVELFGYTIYSNGVILGLNGKPIRYQKNIKVVHNGKPKEISYARFVYYAFHQDTFDIDNHNIVVRHKDGQLSNNDICNLYATNRKNYLHGEKHLQAKLTDEEVEKIKDLYNGQSVKGKLNCPNKEISYRKLADMYGVSHSLIRGIIKGTYRNKDNYVIK